ncbi:class I SAM-dependent DNA methyltransferase [Limosilactobacillus difficilis]|uniref:class I SAM-dependent DNA methyltransferase n=1 Tax=Limosilactobacillus difficilis TaxID=2991838 RepID=UPI0024B8E8A1|nr:class I SAM-dependent methyltransferase [Limosilactobacillus difficilis]
MAIYSSFAQVYDAIFDKEQYRRWADYAVSRILNRRPAVLDLAGGAGRLAVLLAQRGMVMTNLDQSEEMLALASEHAGAAGVDVRLIAADMRQLAGLPKYDAVTCFADSLNYLPQPEDVQQTLEQVFRHIKDGGVFLFDAITLYQCDVVYPGYMYNYQDEDAGWAFMWSSYANDDVNHGVIHDLAIFQQQDDGSYQRFAETHFERAYSLAWWRQSLLAAGFKDVQVSADFGQKSPADKTRRYFFECHK